MSKPSKATRAEIERAHRMRAKDQARDEGIREGLLMAMQVISERNLPSEADARLAILARGGRHFGDSNWYARPRGSR